MSLPFCTVAFVEVCWDVGVYRQAVQSLQLPVRLAECHFKSI